jgi:serine/threonine protein phosphatase PrpC
MFSGMIIKSQTGYFFHAGDSRIYLIREGTLKQLTRDHIASIRNGRSFLAWAMGMDNSIQIDYGKVALQPGDRLLISQALANGSDDNLSCAVVEDRQSGKTLVMKTLSVNFVDDTGNSTVLFKKSGLANALKAPKWCTLFARNIQEHFCII